MGLHRVIRSYTELLSYASYEERLRFLHEPHIVGEETFGGVRELNQEFYRSELWRQTRAMVIARDWGFDLGIKDRIIVGPAIVHHMVVLLPEDFLDPSHSIYLLNPEYLITCSGETHRRIHYGQAAPSLTPFVERAPNDVAPWRLV